MRRGVCRGNLRNGDDLQDIGIGITVILTLFLKKLNLRTGTGLIWLSLAKIGLLLGTRPRNIVLR